MKIGILSDTHGDLKGFEDAMTIIGDADAIIHCGDILCAYRRGENIKPADLAKKISVLDHIHLVHGNGDDPDDEILLGHKLHSPDLILELDEYKIFATHSHHFSRMQMILRAQERGTNVLCYGHTHIKELDADDRMIVINPGSTSVPRDGCRSCAVIENHIAKIYNLDTGQMIAVLPVPRPMGPDL